MTRLITFYGDDFTGSTDVMESLASHGVKTVLFTRKPTETEFAPFADCEAIGLAGTSRSQTPDWMRKNLPDVFLWLKSLNARFCHYKVCSTFDSAPHVGSIGCAIDQGARVFDQAMVPLIVGVPQLKRYTFAGHLFADYKGDTYRIDRHPVMGVHPVTPMGESDLRQHLSKQTQKKVELVKAQWPENGIGLLDVNDFETQRRAGQKLFTWPGGFVVGSSGVEYALLSSLSQQATLHQSSTFSPLEATAQLLVVSGSVSPTTERQIHFALKHGFESLPVDVLALAKGETSYRHSIVEKALRILSEGKSPLVHSALGPTSDVGKRIEDVPEGRRKTGEALGAILRLTLEATFLRRAIVAGGDTSGHALGQLDVFALTTRMPLPQTPGSPVCVAHSTSPRLDGIEIALKGGQVGADDYFVALRNGQV